MIYRGDKLRGDDCIPCQLPDSVRPIADPDPLSMGTALRLWPYILPTGRPRWLSELPSGSLDIV